MKGSLVTHFVGAAMQGAIEGANSSCDRTVDVYAAARQMPAWTMSKLFAECQMGCQLEVDIGVSQPGCGHAANRRQAGSLQRLHGKRMMQICT